MEDSVTIARKTKIIVTLGENSSSKAILIDLINAGMDVARISSRFLKIDKQEVIDNLREAMKETGKHVPIMLGLRESDIRIGTIGNKPVLLRKNEIVRISPTPEENEKICTLLCNNKEFSTLVQPDDKLLLDFGKIILTVVSGDESENEEISGSSEDFKSTSGYINIDTSKAGNIMYMLNSKVQTETKSVKKNSFNQDIQRPKRLPKLHKNSKAVYCRVENDCIITLNKPVHISTIRQADTPISDATVAEDFKLIEWANENKIDFIVFKQVRNKEDLEFLMYLCSSEIHKLLGLQTKRALSMLGDHISDVDGAVIGRGTLALETSLADVCKIQKEIVHRCNDLGKPVIISTQLLESMVFKSFPTCSEVTDITNAVLDGADALLLCGETAYGIDPVKTLNMCSRICIEAEKSLDYTNQCQKVRALLGKEITPNEENCYYAVMAANCAQAKAIVCITESGLTAKIISRYMPRCTIIALTNSQKSARQLKLQRGIYPFYAVLENRRDIFSKVLEIIKENSFASIGDNIVLIGEILQNLEPGLKYLIYAINQ